MSPGWTKVDNDSVIARLPEIDGTALKVLLVLVRRADATGMCWPSVATICKETGIRERAVQGAIRRLKALGLLTVEHQPGRSATYHITPAPPCTPAQASGAPGCATPPHQDAGAPAPPCATPPHHGAPKQEPGNNTQEQHPGNKTQARRKAAVVAIPRELESAEFAVAWGEWLQHRREILKPATPTAQRKQLAKLTRWGIARAIIAIDHSVGEGWQGIFEPKESGNGKSNGRYALPNGDGQRNPADAKRNKF